MFSGGGRRRTAIFVVQPMEATFVRAKLADRTSVESLMKTSYFLALSLAAALLPAGSSASQDEQELGADEILDLAIARQNGQQYAAYTADFEVRLMMIDNHPQRGKVTFDVDCRYKKPNRIYTSVREPVTEREFVEGFDGQNAWYKDQDGLKLYEGRDYVEDRKKLTDTAATMRRLLRFFFLGNLKKSLRDVERGPDASYTDPKTGQTIHAYYVTGLGSEGGSDDADTKVEIWVEKKTHYLRGVTFTPIDDEVRSVNFTLAYHRPNPQGVVVPGMIKVFHAGQRKESQRIVLLTEDGRNDIRFNVGLKDDLFSPPEP